MKRFILRWILLVISLVVAAALTNLLLPEQFLVRLRTAENFLHLMLAVAVLSLVNATLGTLLKLLTLPLNCLTLGLVSLFINGLIFYFVGQAGLGFETKSFFAAFVGSILYSAVNGVLGAFLPDKSNDKD